MWGLETIIRMNKEAGGRARNRGTKPFRLCPGFEWPPKAARPPLDIPFIGDQEEKFDADLVRLETLFVDISGFGAEGEPALTLAQLGDRLRELTAEHGPVFVAMVERGQFQAHLGVWKEG